MTAPAVRYAAAGTLAVLAVPAGLALHEWLHAANDWANGRRTPVTVEFMPPEARLGRMTGRGMAGPLEHADEWPLNHWTIYPLQVLFVLACLYGAYCIAFPHKVNP